MSRRKRSKSWYDKHSGDPFVRKAQASGSRSRARFKLEQIDKRDRLIRPGMRIVDLGAAPGGWSEYVAEKLNGRGSIVAVDLLPIEPLENVHVLQMDFSLPGAVTDILDALGGERCDLVLSDAAPNISGIRDADAALSVELARQVFELACALLRPGGNLLLKIFEGPDVREFEAEIAGNFTEIKRRKPTASRAASREIYLLARNFRMV